MREILTTILLLFSAMALVLLAGMLVVGEGDGRWKHEGIFSIRKPAWQIFPHITEPKKRKLWKSGLVESVPITTGQPRVGTKYREVIQDGDKRVEWNVEITDLVPEKSVTLSMTSNEVDCVVRYDFAIGQSTKKSRIRYFVDYQFHHWMWKILEPVAGHIARDRIEQDLERLRTNLEFGGMVEPGES